MEVLKQYIETSKELKTLLEKEFSAEERDTHIQKTEELLNTRQLLLNQFPDLSALQESAKAAIVQLEKEVQALMEKQKEQIKKDIKTLQVKKQKNQQYADPYGDLSTDGMFLDKKK